jgi:hypothetical protein
MAKNLVRIAEAIRSGSKEAVIRDLSMEDEPRKALKENMTRNSGRDFWYWKDKPQAELGVVETLIEAAEFDVAELVARTDDPPDCEALVNGERCGIEATELVHQKSAETVNQQPARASFRLGQAKPVQGASGASRS